MKALPLHAEWEAEGAVWGDDAGWQVPLRFATEGYAVARGLSDAGEKTAAFDISHAGKIVLRGPDASTFLHNLCTNDVKSLKPGDGCEAFLTTNKAKLVAHFWVHALGDEKNRELHLDMSPGLDDVVARHLDHFLISENVEIENLTSSRGMLRLCGPHAIACVQRAFGVSDLPMSKLVAGAGQTWQVRRHRLLATESVDVFFPVGEAHEIWRRLRDAHATPAGAEPYETLRIEAGLPKRGAEWDETRFVVELDRTKQAICYTKGCYLGQEPIVMARDRGQVNRRLMGVVLGSSPDPAWTPGTTLFKVEAESGQLTSTTFSPTLGKYVGLAFLRRGGWEAGTELTLRPGAGAPKVKVVSLPMVQ